MSAKVSPILYTIINSKYNRRISLYVLRAYKLSTTYSVQFLPRKVFYTAQTLQCRSVKTDIFQRYKHPNRG